MIGYGIPRWWSNNPPGGGGGGSQVPRLSGTNIAPIEGYVGDDPTTRNGAAVFFGEDLAYTILPSDGAMSVNSSTGLIDITFDEVEAPSATYLLVATNSHGARGYALHYLCLDVPPQIVAQLPTITSPIGGSPTPIDLSTLVAGENLVFTLVSSPLFATLDGDTLTPIPSAPGLYQIVVDAENTGGVERLTFPFEVLIAAPTLVFPVGDLEFSYGIPANYDLGPHVLGETEWILIPSNSFLSINPSTGLLTPNVTAPRAATPFVAVASNSTDSLEVEFTALVALDPPVAVGEISDLLLTQNTGPHIFSILPFFGGDLLSFSVSGSASAALQGTDLVIQTTSVVAETLITLTAENPSGEVDQTFFLEVEAPSAGDPRPPSGPIFLDSHPADGTVLVCYAASPFWGDEVEAGDEGGTPGHVEVVVGLHTYEVPGLGSEVPASHIRGAPIGQAQIGTSLKVGRYPDEGIYAPGIDTCFLLEVDESYWGSSRVVSARYVNGEDLASPVVMRTIAFAGEGDDPLAGLAILLHPSNSAFYFTHPSGNGSPLLAP